MTRSAEVPAVMDFSMKVLEGDAMGLVGESGCGKSTVALAIMKYLGGNGKITGGTIKYRGKDMSSFSEKELEDINKRESDQEEKLSMSLRDGLLTGAAFAAVPALVANYTINRASDDIDAKMIAIPGLAAATVGAILAAKHMNSGKLPSNPPIEELETAINAKQVVDSAIDNTEDSATLSDLEKMSSISTDHIAGLLTDILV